MQKSKLVFSEAELKLVKNQDIILTKTRVIERVYTLFGEISKDLYKTFMPLHSEMPQVFLALPKISKGENYQGFPWVMLDYPRYFDRQYGHFALRIFFWWGHYFLVQIHLSGNFFQMFKKLLLNDQFRELLNEVEVFVGNPIDPWDCNIPQSGMENLGKNGEITGKMQKSYGKIMIPIALEDTEKLCVIAQKMGGILVNLEGN